MNSFLKFGLLVAVLLVVAANGQRGRACSNEGKCRCKLRRQCVGDAKSTTHFDFMPEEWAVPVLGNRARKNPSRFCLNECLNLFKSYLGDGYNATIDDKVEDVRLDQFIVDVGHHRICQSAPKTIEDCEFRLQFKGGCGPTEYYDVGRTGCVVFEHDDGAMGVIQLKFAADVAAQEIAYMGNPPLVYTALIGALETSAELM